MQLLEQPEWRPMHVFAVEPYYIRMTLSYGLRCHVTTAACKCIMNTL
jgi:hypothetical protein